MAPVIGGEPKVAQRLKGHLRGQYIDDVDGHLGHVRDDFLKKLNKTIKFTNKISTSVDF